MKKTYEIYVTLFNKTHYGTPRSRRKEKGIKSVINNNNSNSNRLKTPYI